MAHGDSPSHAHREGLEWQGAACEGDVHRASNRFQVQGATRCTTAFHDLLAWHIERVHAPPCACLTPTAAGAQIDLTHLIYPFGFITSVDENHLNVPQLCEKFVNVRLACLLPLFMPFFAAAVVGAVGMLKLDSLMTRSSSFACLPCAGHQFAQVFGHEEGGPI